MRCGLGRLVAPIAWRMVGWVWAYNLAWMFVLGGIRLITEQFAAYRTARHIKSAALVNQSPQPHLAA